MATDQVIAQVRKWRDELIDLTRRNRLLNLSRTRRSSLRVVEPGYEEVLRELHGKRGWRFHYPPLDDEEKADATFAAAIEAEDTELTDVRELDELLTDIARSRDLSTILRNLERRAAQEYLDKGLRVLYLAIGLLEWTDAAGDGWRSPLVLVPVTITRPNPRAPFRLSGTDDDPIVNPALTVKLGIPADNMAGPNGVGRVVYFDYDSFTIKPDFQPLIESHARFIKGANNRKVVVEGNTDERGGREYNLALGQKRAEAVRQALGLLGVPDSQVEAVSFGKEKPADTGASEEAFAKNRRAEIAYR